jgi:hypothetical protein
MKEYQLLILTLEGSVKEQYALKCADDTDARKRAKKFLTTYAVELWDGPRRVVPTVENLRAVGIRTAMSAAALR